MVELKLALGLDDLLRQAAGQDPDLIPLYERADFKALVNVSEIAP